MPKPPVVRIGCFVTGECCLDPMLNELVSPPGEVFNPSPVLFPNVGEEVMFVEVTPQGADLTFMGSTVGLTVRLECILSPPTLFSGSLGMLLAGCPLQFASLKLLGLLKLSTGVSG